MRFRGLRRDTHLFGPAPGDGADIGIDQPVRLEHVAASLVDLLDAVKDLLLGQDGGVQLAEADIVQHAFALREEGQVPHQPFEEGAVSVALPIGGGGEKVSVANVEAGDAARFNHDGGRQPTEALEGPAADPLGTLYVEPGIPIETIEKLRAMGHKVEVIDNGVMFGGYQAIARDPETGVLTGATEMRKDGQASGY